MLLYSYLQKDKLDSNSISYRFGIIPSSIAKKLSNKNKKVWIHAVSVGEINAITQLVQKLILKEPELDIIISTMTSTGKQTAYKNLKNVSKIIYLPFDFPWSTRRIMKIINPDIFVTIETEIWPNILKAARKQGSKVLMLNGRISPRSIKSYQRILPFLKTVLENYHLFSMIMPHDAQRIIDLGAEPSKVVINGNTKYDHLIDKVSKNTPSKVYQILNLPDDSKIFVAGSTRTGEEDIILEVYKRLLTKYPKLILIIAPRHIKRGNTIKDLFVNENFKTILKTEIDHGKQRNDEQVIIIDTIGDLFDIYSIATVVFCGASLVPKGGQNIIEPAAWGKPVVFGPSMDDFLDAKDILKEADAGIEVKDSQELFKEINLLLGNDQLRKDKGEKAHQAVFTNKGASEKNAELVLEYLGG